MGRLRSRGLLAAVAIISLWGGVGCGGRKPAGTSPFPAKITLSPGSSTSVQAGSTFNFVASAQNSSNGNLNLAFTFQSNDTSVLNVAPNGVACAGIWDVTFTICTPGAIGVAQVTASADGYHSEPTYVFVHPKIDNIVVTGVLLDSVRIQEPCLPQTKTMTVQATAYSQGVDVTSSVGPFTWSANNPSVVRLTPLNDSNYSFPTDQATATAVNPGMTQIYASASGVSSTEFHQPNLTPGVQQPSPAPFEFFETCPIQNIVLEVGSAGSNQTEVSLAKGATGASVIATLTDVLGSSSLTNLNNDVVLKGVPLTWSASQPQVLNVATGCTQSCGLSLLSPGAGSVTASCAPPTCNVGFPEVPNSLAPANLAACVSYLQQFFPQIKSCEEFIPKPVFASPLPNHNTAAIAGLITGTTTGNAAILASSLGCAGQPPTACTVGLYDFASGKALSGSANMSPNAPNSMMFTLAGDKVYVGSNYGAEIVNPANFGTANPAFSSISPVTGRVLAVSPNGNLSIFSDVLHTPNQVFVVNETNPQAPVLTPLTIQQASAAAFSPDNQKAFIFGLDTNNLPNLYVYSSVQAIQTIPLPPGTTVSTITFSTNGAFVYIAEPSAGGAGPAVSVLNNCDNSLATPIPLTAPPIVFRALPDGVHFVALENGGVLESITAKFSVPSQAVAATPTSPATFLCSTTSQGGLLALNVTNSISTINLNLGNVQPINFFMSADGALLYLVVSDLNSVLVYNFETKSLAGGIQLLSTPGGVNPSPVTADMTVDGGTIVIAGDDGYVHELSTSNGGADLVQAPFPSLPNSINAFCTNNVLPIPCLLDFVAVKP